MGRFFIPLLILAGFLWASPSEALRVPEVFYQEGDDYRWATQNFDHNQWPQATLYALPQFKSVFWLRATVDIPPDSASIEPPWGILISALASYEVYWDGQPLGQSGVVGKPPQEEVPGPIQGILHLPTALASPGRHTLALRGSAKHMGFDATTWFYYIALGNHPQIAARSSIAGLIPIGALGALVLAGLYFLVLFLLDPPQKPYFVLCLFCFSVAGQLLVEAWRTWDHYPYDWHIVRLRLIVAFAGLSAFLLVLFLLLRFRHRHLKRWLLVTVAVQIGVIGILPGYDFKTIAALLVGLFVSLGLCLEAGRRRQQGAYLAACGVTVTGALLLWRSDLFLDISLFYGFGFLIACLLVTQALQTREERRAHFATKINAVRLELELLKRYLQPHFLLNTLTALAELFEEDPRTAGKTLEALARELRTLGDVAAQRLIPMGREIELCRDHLLIMGMRRDQNFILETQGVDLQSTIPPAVFHTLVENALSHNRYDAPVVQLRLHEEPLAGGRRYLFIAPSVPTRSEPTSIEDVGTGLRYIEARLKEGFDQRWTLHQQAINGFWQTEITILDD